MADFKDALPTECEKILDIHGFVRLMDAMPRLIQINGLGPEEAIIQAARVSCGKLVGPGHNPLDAPIKESTITQKAINVESKRTLKQDEALMRYLFRNKHMTPFEMIVTKWCIKAPIFTVRQWMRHRAGSFNEQSARYGVVPTEFYFPEVEDIKSQSETNKQSSDEPLPTEIAEEFRTSVQSSYDMSASAYDDSIETGVARELARITLPEGRYTTFYWTVNLRNLFHFLALRMSADAQSNIRQYASAIFDIVKEYCPLASKAFEDYELNTVSITGLELRALSTGSPPTEMSIREKTEWEAKKMLIFNTP